MNCQLCYKLETCNKCKGCKYLEDFQPDLFCIECLQDEIECKFEAKEI